MIAIVSGVSRDSAVRNLHRAPVDLVIVRLDGAAEQGNSGDNVNLIQADVPDFLPTPRWISTTTNATTIVTERRIGSDRAVRADPETGISQKAGRIAAAPSGGINLVTQ